MPVPRPLALILCATALAACAEALPQAAPHHPGPQDHAPAPHPAPTGCRPDGTCWILIPEGPGFAPHAPFAKG